MAGEQSGIALARIEAALERIARAADKSISERRDIDARHAALRSAVKTALADIDSLIGGTPS